MNWVKPLLLTLLLTWIAPAPQAVARNHFSDSGGQSAQSLDEAVSRARAKTGGRVLSAETRTLEGRPTHHIRILTEDGKVRRLRVDAASGRRLQRPRRR